MVFLSLASSQKRKKTLAAMLLLKVFQRCPLFLPLEGGVLSGLIGACLACDWRRRDTADGGGR